MTDAGLAAALVRIAVLEDRAPGRLLLAGLTDQGIRRALSRACPHAGVGHDSPHDLRHRYISLLVLAGVPITLVRDIVGHAEASLMLGTYAHVLLDEPAARLEALRRGVLVVSRWSGWGGRKPCYLRPSRREAQ